MSDNINICPECGTENEEQYIYCKNCGTTLKESKPEPTLKEDINTNQADDSASGCYSSPNNDYSCIDGIPYEDIQLFIGTKSNNIMPKFINMEISHSKNSWCWPPAVLAFFFGPFGAALWFFYRKMYKHAFILTAIGAVLSLITSLLTINTTSTYAQAIIKAFTDGNMSDIMPPIEGLAPSVFDTIASAIENIVNIATSVIVGIFSAYWYKNHCVAKIKEFRAMNPDNNYYKLGLMYLGKTSGGMLALGILLALGIGYIVTFITTIISTII